MTTQPAPILASAASRKFMRGYVETGTDVHELAADAIHLAENRGVEAVLRALGAMVTDQHEVIIPTGTFRDLQRRIDQELGR